MTDYPADYPVPGVADNCIGYFFSAQPVIQPVSIWCEKQSPPVDVVGVGVVKKTSLKVEATQAVLVVHCCEALTLNVDCGTHILRTVNTPKLNCF